MYLIISGLTRKPVITEVSHFINELKINKYKNDMGIARALTDSLLSLLVDTWLLLPSTEGLAQGCPLGTNSSCSLGPH